MAIADSAEPVWWRRNRIHRTGTLAAAAVTTVALLTGATLWVNGGGLDPADAGQTNAPVAGAAAKPLPPVIQGDTWTWMADDLWFRISKGPAGKDGLGVAGWHARFSDRPEPVYNPKGPSAAVALVQPILDRGWLYPFGFAGGDRGPATERPYYEVAFLRGDVRSAVFTISRNNDTVRHQAKIYRLASLPGWVMAVASPYRPADSPRDTSAPAAKLSFDAYDAQGERVLRCSIPTPGAGPSCER